MVGLKTGTVQKVYRNTRPPEYPKMHLGGILGILMMEYSPTRNTRKGLMPPHLDILVMHSYGEPYFMFSV